MRRYIAILMAATMVLTMFGCKKEDDTTTEYETEVNFENYENETETETTPNETILETEQETPYETEEFVPEETTENIEIVVPSESDTENSNEDDIKTLEEPPVDKMDEIMWAKSGVNVRDYPSTAGKVIGALAFAQPVNVTGKTESGWYQVEYNGEVGYVNGGYLLDYQPQKKNSVDKQLDSITNYTAGVPQETIQEMYKYWRMVPEQTRNRIVEKGYKINVLNTRYLPDFEGQIIANANYQNKTITMGNAKKHVTRSLNHNIGHVVDHMYNWPSHSEEWKEIYEAEKGKMQIQNNYDSSQLETTWDFFAECVLQFIQYNDLLWQTCPRAYKFVQKYVF